MKYLIKDETSSTTNFEQVKYIINIIKLLRMNPLKVSKHDIGKKKYIKIKKIFLYYLLILTFFLLFLFAEHTEHTIRINQKIISKDNINKLNKPIDDPLNIIRPNNNLISYKKCYLSLVNIRIIHLIITRFLIEFYHSNEFPKKLYSIDYIPNGIRVMKKYLLPSLENQSCKNFTWVLMLGNKANITYINSLINFNNSFESKVIYQKDIKYFVKNITKGFDVLITTRIDYDDIIYYDAVNDVRKAINMNKPILLYGYNRGIYYFEKEGKFYDFYRTYKNEGCMSIFASLIIALNKVNDTYIVYDLITHKEIRKRLLEKYKSYGIKKIVYEPAIFDSGDPKFVWVRQKYSGSYIQNKMKNQLIIKNFNLNKFFGK